MMKNPDTLKIQTLSGDWCDKDIVMLHACFQLLTDCIEEEKLLTGNTDWNNDLEHTNAKKEIEELYNWWTERKKLEQKEGINDLDRSQYQKDNEMLIRLINIRQYLWT
jgi:hypothetical protein